MQTVSILSNDRVFITGKTGSGKTYLARYLTQHLKRLVVLDGKGTLGGNEWNLQNWSREGENLLTRGEPVRLRVVPPMTGELSSFWDTFLLTCIRAGNVVIYIDELYAVVPPNKTASPPVFAAYTRGRELGIGVWASTQRPVWIPLVALSEAEHFFMFRLQLAEDKQRLAAFMGREVIRDIKDKHGFYYSRAIDDRITYYRQFKPAEVGISESKPVEMPKTSDLAEKDLFWFWR